MEQSYKKLARAALADGHAISVFDGGEWQVKRSTDYAAIIAAIESVEQAELRIRNAAGDAIGWALIIPFGVGPDETVADYSCTEYMQHLDARAVL